MSERRFVGLPVTPTSVLLLTEEPPATVEEKVDRFGVNEERVFVISRRQMGVGYSWPKTVAAAVAFCRIHPEVGICVVDTWDKFAGLSSSKSETDTGTIVEMIEPLYELLGLNVCVVLITHQRKQEGDYGLRVRGGTAFTGSADVIIEVERPPESAGLSKDARVLKLVSRFSGAPDEIAVELGENGWRALGTVREASRRSKRDEILAVLGDEPLTREEIATAAGLPETTVRRRLASLVEHDLADRIGEGKRQDPYRWRISENGRFILASRENGLAGNVQATSRRRCVAPPRRRLALPRMRTGALARRDRRGAPMSRSRLYAITCVVCKRDLVYVACVHENGRRVQDRWTSRYFGCDCPSRPRLVGEDTWKIVFTGRGPRERIERWGRRP